MTREQAAHLALSRLLELAGIAAPGLAADPVVTGVTHDSSAVAPGALFVAIRGGRDGADFARAAVERGAVAVVASSPDRGLGVPWIVVDDDRAALADLATVASGRPSERLLVFGVTGTNGKTTTVAACASILEAGGAPVGVIGTIETRCAGRRAAASRTTPEASELQPLLAEMADSGCAAAVMEVSSHGIDLQRVRGVRFAAIAFANLSQDHLDWHGDIESYFAAKTRLFTELAPDAPAVMGADDVRTRALAWALRERDPGRVVITAGLAEDADLRVVELDATPEGSRFRLRGEGSATGLPEAVDVAVSLRLPGAHNVQNAALAAGLALVTGAPPALVAEGLGRLAGVPGRLEPVDAPAGGGGGFHVYVDYAHTPAALEGVLDAARGLARSRVVCVFGCGGDRDRAKRPLMARAVGDRADVAVLTSDNPRSEDPAAIVAEAMTGLVGARAESHVELDRRKAIALALGLARRGDVVVIAGKGHETYQEIQGTRHPFDDRVVAREEWAALRSQG